MRYDRRSSMKGISVAYQSGSLSHTRVLGLKLVQLAQAQLYLWRNLGGLLGLLIGVSLLALLLLLAAILGRVFRGQRFLFWPWSPGSTRLVVLFSYDKLRVEL
jgi:hypothetical protein